MWAPKCLGSVAVGLWLSCSVSRGTLAHWPGIEHRPPPLGGGFLPSGPPGKSLSFAYNIFSFSSSYFAFLISQIAVCIAFHFHKRQIYIYFFESSFGKAAIWLYWLMTSMDMNLTPWMEISHLTATWEERPPFWMLAFYGDEQVHKDSWWEENGPYLSVSDRPAECVGWFLRFWRMGRERGRPGERERAEELQR